MNILYSAAAERDYWPVFLDQLVRVSRSRSARLLVMNATADEVHSSAKINIDDRAHQNYLDYYVNACPWRPELRQKPPGRLYSTYLDFSCRQKSFYRTEFYNDWARQLDIHHGVCGTVYRNNEHTIQLLVQRTGDQGPYDHGDTAWFNHLIPHVRRSIELARHMSQLRRQCEAGTQAAHRPFAILNAGGRIEYLCQRAEALISGESNLAYNRGRLMLQPGRLQQRFSQLVNGVIASAGRGWRHAGGALPVARPGKAPLICIVSPLVLEVGNTVVPRSGRALLYFHLPELEGKVDETLVEQLFDLTPAEARVAKGVAEGRDLRALADEQGTAVETVRGQLKSVFRKTGTRRQNELANRILKSPALRPSQAPPITLS